MNKSKDIRFIRSTIRDVYDDVAQMLFDDIPELDFNDVEDIAHKTESLVRDALLAKYGVTVEEFHKDCSGV